jgi:DinB family protein
VAALDTVKKDLLDLSDYAYGRLRSRLDGLTTEEYLWEPVPGCWSVRPEPDGTARVDGSDGPVDPAPVTTIAWRMWHIIGLLADGRNATWIGVTPTGTLRDDTAPATAPAAMRRLEEAYALFRGHVAAVDASTLVDAMGPVSRFYADSTREAFILHELDELIHHGAEVAVLRDLYRASVHKGLPLA